MPTHRGRVLDVDLSTGTVATTEVDDATVRKYIGGSGMAAHLFLDSVSPDVDPLSPDNVLFLMAGPLAGTGAPGSSRFTMSCKSPLTGIWGEAAGGGTFAPAVKRAGYDGIVIRGASDKPVYLEIENEKATLRDAADLWGKDVYDTVDVLTARGEGRVKPKIVSIGPAGENLVKFSVIANGKDAFAARAGGGTLMGAKKLKAVSVLGTGPVDPAFPDELKQLRKELIAKVKENIIALSLQAQGTIMAMDVTGPLGDIPTKNYSIGDPGPMAPAVGGAVLTEKYLVRPDACEACPIACKRLIKAEGGPFPLEEGPGPEYETAAAFGTLLMNDDMPAVLKLNELANRYGVDSISCGAAIAFAMECFEKGVLTTEDLDGASLRWGNVEDILRTLDSIVHRRGIGDVLAEGTRAAARRIGKGSEAFTCEVKGLDSPMHDGRALHGMGLGYAMGNRGACHVQNLDLALESNWCAYPEVGLPGGYVGMSSEGKADMVVKCENLGMLTNACIICQFNMYALSVHDLVNLMNFSTGFDYTLEELMECGDRIWMLKRGLNNLMGVTAADDRLPERMLTPFQEGAAAGSLPDMELMLREYYPLRGLNADGRPLRERLEKLGLSALASRL